MKNMFKTMIAIGILTISSIASAVTIVPETLVIDFGTGIGSGGTFDITTDINGDVLSVSGTNIFIGAVNIEGAVQNNGGYTSNAYLNFDTADGNNYMTVVGTIGSLGNGDLMTSQTLLSGSFLDWNLTDYGYVLAFSGSGNDTKSDDLLTAVGAPLDTTFAFFGFSLESYNGNVVSTDIVNTATGNRDIPEVPVPAAVWLFGSGLLGMIGVARRKV